MKLQTSNLMIGTVTLAAIAGVLSAFLIYKNFAGKNQRIPLRVVFEGSALGLNKGGSVNFGGVRVGEVVSLKLDNPRRIVALAMIDGNTPMRKDTQAGLEFQGLTGVAALSLLGGSADAPPVPLDQDGVPILVADADATLDVQTKIKIAMQNVNKVLDDNRADLRDTLLNVESFTSVLAINSQKAGPIIDRAEKGVLSASSGVSKTLEFLESLDRFDPDDLLLTVKSTRELAVSFNKKSAVFLNEGRVMLRDISASVNKGKLGAR